MGELPPCPFYPPALLQKPVSGLPLKVPAFPYAFDPLVRSRARAYQRGSLALSLFSGTFVPLALALGLLWSGLSRALADGAYGLLPHSAALADGLYVLALSTLASALTLPLAIYGRHLREKRFGMSRLSLGQFLRDALKSALFATVVALALLLPLLALIRRSESWWAAASLLYGAFLALSTFVLPNLVMPLFYKVEPLAEGPLKSAVLSAVEAAGAPPIRRIAVLRESAKSPRANAFIHGFGPSRRIVLFDTLLASFHPREVRFIVAHEAAHLAHRDVPKALSLGLALVPVKLYLLAFGLWALAPAFGLRGPGDAAGVPLLLLLAGLIELAERVALSPLARRAEARADASALSATCDPVSAESMMARLCDLNLIDEAPPRLVEALLFSHPSPQRRIQSARAFARGVASAPADPLPAPFTAAGNIRTTSENP